MEKLCTINRNVEFYYKGSIQNGIVLEAGKTRTKYKIDKDLLKKMVEEFSGKKVIIGTSRTVPPKDTLGYWIKQNNNNNNFASYICPILVHEGYAEVIDNKTIRFIE